MPLEPLPPTRGLLPGVDDGRFSTFDPMRPHRPPRRVRRARTTLLGLLLGTFVVVGFLTYRRVSERLRHGLDQQISTIVATNEGAARTWLTTQQNRAHDIAASPLIAVEATRVISTTGSERNAARATLDARLEPLRSAGTIVNYGLLTPQGELVASLTPSDDLRAMAADVHSRVLARGAGISAPRFRDDGPDAPPAVLIGTGATIGSVTAPTGVLLLVIDFAPLAESLRSTRWGDTGETYAFDRLGFMMTESRHTSALTTAGLLRGRTSSLRLRLVDPAAPATDGPLEGAPLTFMAAEATRGTSGSNFDGYRNYLGRKVVGAWRWLPEYGFGIASEVAKVEAFDVIDLIRRAALVLAVIILMALGGLVALSRWTLQIRERSVLVSQRLDHLARAIQPLSAVLENEPGAVLLVDNHLEVVYANPATVRLVGTAEPLAGAPIGTVFAKLPPQLREALVEGQDTVVSVGDEDAEETVLVSTRQLTIDGKAHALCMVRPVTQELRRREVEHWKKLIRVMSHELNNSLAPITSLVSSARKLARGGENADKLEKVFATITERTDHLLAFLQSYANLARLPRPTRREVDWNAFVEGLRAQFDFKLLGEPPGNGGFFDPVQLERVFVNLLKNARESGGPPEDVSLRIVEDGKGVRLDVQDRGGGMSPRVLEQAMLPFYSTKRTGTGVGLALAREIVEAHHGRITLANREGGGLSVSVWIPDRADHLLSTSL